MIATLPISSAYERLKTRQRLFVDYYISTCNGAEAARQAGYSPKSAVKIASENLTKPDIRLAIDEKLKAIQGETELSPRLLRQKTAKLVHDGTLRPDTQLKAIELAGKMTPGTFEAAAPTTQTLNIFAVIQRINTMSPDELATFLPPAQSVTPTSQRINTVSPSTVELPTPTSVHSLPNIEKTHCPSSAVEVITIASAVETANVSTGGEGENPPSGPVYGDMTTPKILQQFQQETTSVVTAEGSYGDTETGREGI